MPAPNFETTIPSEVQDALDGIMEDVYVSEMREDIVTAVTWGLNNVFPVARFINGLGLTVEDHKLCYTTKNVLPTYNAIPSNIQAFLGRILTDTYGPYLREAVTEVLRWADGYVSQVAGFAEDLGLTVVDGKLCAIFYPDGNV